MLIAKTILPILLRSTPQVYTSMYQYPGIFVAQLPQSTIRIGYLVSSDMGLLVSDTNDH
jgi:hypothetical protein